MTVSRSWHLCANGLLTQSAFSVACDKPQGKSDHGYRQDSAYRGHGVPKPPLAALLLRSIPADPGAALTGQRPRTETPLPARPGPFRSRCSAAIAGGRRRLFRRSAGPLAPTSRKLGCCRCGAAMARLRSAPLPSRRGRRAPLLRHGPR